MVQYQSKDLKSNRRRATTYYLTLAGIAILVLALIGVAVTGVSLAKPAEGSRQAQLVPERKYEVGDIARFVVAGGLVHQGPIGAYRIDSNNRWVYDVEFPATDSSGEASVWRDLEEYRILLVDEDSPPYQPRVEGYPVKLVDPATGERVDDDVNEGIVQGSQEIGGIWNYPLLVSNCKVILPREGLVIVLVNNLVEPFTCTPEPGPAPTEEPTEEPDGTDGVTGSDTVDPTPTSTPTPEPPTPTPPQACHPSYEGACLDPNAEDYDCEGGSGDGPLYTGEVKVVGPDVFELDHDNDGIGCE